MNDLKVRTRAFALAVIKLVEQLPVGRTADVVGRQLLRSGTSVAANYRAARRSKSRRDFIAKMGSVEEEADESEFWLDVIGVRGMAEPEQVLALRHEASELVAITVASIRTARGASTSVPRSPFRVPRSIR